MSVCLSVSLVCLSVCSAYSVKNMSPHGSVVNRLVSLSMCLSVCLSVCLQHIFCEDSVSTWFSCELVCLSVCLRLSVCLCVSVCLSVCLCICLSVSVYSTYSVKTAYQRGSVVNVPVRCVELTSSTLLSGEMAPPVLVSRSTEHHAHHPTCGLTSTCEIILL